FNSPWRRLKGSRSAWLGKGKEQSEDVSYLDLVDVADGMVELNGAALLHIGLLSRPTVCAGRTGSSRCRGVGSPGGRGMVHGSTILVGRHRPLLDRAGSFKRSTVARTRIARWAVLRWHTERCFRTFRAVGQRRLPTWSRVHEPLR